MINRKADTITFNDAARRGVARQDRCAARSVLPYGTPNKDMGTTIIPAPAPTSSRSTTRTTSSCGAQPVLQAVVGRRAARGLPSTRSRTRSASRSRPRSRRSRTAGRLDARLAAGRPPQRDRHEVPEPGAHQHALRGLVPADERQHPAVQQQARAPGRQLCDRPQRSRAHPRRPEARPCRPARCCRRASRVTSTTARTRRTRAAASGPRPTWPRPRRSSSSRAPRARRSPSCPRMTRSTSRWRSTSRACSTRSATRRPSSRSRATSRSRTCRTPRTRCRSASRSGTRTTRRPSDFLNVLLGCDSFHPGSDSSINMSGYCNKAVDAKMKKALQLGITNPPAALKLWGQVDKQIDRRRHAGRGPQPAPDRLHVEARRELHLERAVLHDPGPGVGPVSTGARATLGV